MGEGFALHEILCDERGQPCDYRFLEINPAFEKLTGLKREQTLGRTVREVLPSIEQYWIDTYGQVALSGEPCQFQHYSGALDRHFQVTAFSPTKRQFAVVFRDVTHRKQYEEAVRASESRYRELVQLANSAILRWSRDGTVTFFNEYAQRFFGYSAEEMIGKPATLLLPPRDSSGTDLQGLAQDIVAHPE